MYFIVFIEIKAKKTSGVYINEQKIPFRMVVFSTKKLIYNVRNLNLKFVNFESKSSKIVIGFSKNSFDHPRGGMDSNLFEEQRYGSGLLALASWASRGESTGGQDKKNIRFKTTLTEQQIFEQNFLF